MFYLATHNILKDLVMEGMSGFVAAGSDKDIEAAGNEFKKTQKLMDKLANKKVLPKNHVARTKSRLNKKLKALKSA